MPQPQRGTQSDWSAGKVVVSVPGLHKLSGNFSAPIFVEKTCLKVGGGREKNFVDSHQLSEASAR